MCCPSPGRLRIFQRKCTNERRRTAPHPQRFLHIGTDLKYGGTWHGLKLHDMASPAGFLQSLLAGSPSLSLHRPVFHQTQRQSDGHTRTSRTPSLRSSTSRIRSESRSLRKSPSSSSGTIPPAFFSHLTHFHKLTQPSFTQSSNSDYDVLGHLHAILATLPGARRRPRSAALPVPLQRTAIPLPSQRTSPTQSQRWKTRGDPVAARDEL